MLRYFKRHLVLAIVALVISILAQLTTPLVAMMEQQMIDLVTAGDLAGFRQKLLWAGAIVIATALAYFLNALTQKKFMVRFEESLRNDIYDGVMRQSHVHFQEKDTAEQMNMVEARVSTIANNFTGPVFFLLSYGAMAVVVLWLLFRSSVLLGLVSIVCAIISMLPPLAFNKRLGKQLMGKLDKQAALTKALKEALNGHEAICAFGIFAPIRRRFSTTSREKADADYEIEVTISLLENASRVMQKFTWFVAFLLAGGMAIRGDITVGTMMLFITLFGNFCSCVIMYAQMLPILLGTAPTIKQVLAVIDGKETDFTGEKAPSYENELDVQDLSFRYTEDVSVLEDLNLTIRKNEKVALIGASGCGKSTLIRLLSGSYASYSGAICYDGTELRDLDIEKLRRIVTVIHQNTFLFNDSIRFNICLGEEFSQEALDKAVHMSGVDRFLPEVPGGLDGSCGENGANLSGGQKQRIALARALIRGVHFLILDEGVSAIDVVTANEIEQELLDRKELTLLTITHRIKDGLTEQYDRVLMMENGRLKERS